MGDNTGIEWTDATWNPVTGCTAVSSGCDHCYAQTLTERFEGTPGHYFEHGFAVQLRPHLLEQPLRWRRPRRIFVNSMSDLFHDTVPDDYIAQVWAIMATAERHTFQVLTKRPARMRSLLSNNAFQTKVRDEWVRLGNPAHPPSWPLPNVWVGVSAENQKWAEIRVPILLTTEAALRFLSAEPLLGPIDLSSWCEPNGADRARLDWVIAGGESGTGAGVRPMHPDWPRALRDQCGAAGTAFTFKQWGAWAPLPTPNSDGAGRYVERATGRTAADADMWTVDTGHWWGVRRVGKRCAGRVLDDQVWDQTPTPAEVR